MLDTNVWLKCPFYVRFIHLICKHQQENPNPAGHPERPLNFPRKRSLNLWPPLRRLFAVFVVYYMSGEAKGQLNKRINSHRFQINHSGNQLLYFNILITPTIPYCP